MCESSVQGELEAVEDVLEGVFVWIVVWCIDGVGGVGCFEHVHSWEGCYESRFFVYLLTVGFHSIRALR